MGGGLIRERRSRPPLPISIFGVLPPQPESNFTFRSAWVRLRGTGGGPRGGGGWVGVKATPRGKLRIKAGAGDGDRTRYLNLGKVALCQMSYSRVA